LYDVANDKLEQWEKNRSNKNAYQAGYKKKVVVMEKAKVHFSQNNLLNPFGNKKLKMPQVSNTFSIVTIFQVAASNSYFFVAFKFQTSNVWFPALQMNPISIHVAPAEILENFSIHQMIVLQKFFQVQVPEDSPGLFCCCSEWEENRESIISFFNPKSPSIAGWLNPVGHEVEHLLGWYDQVLDGTRVKFPRLIMSYFRSRFVRLFKKVDSGKVT
jgi:hypothetical protein